MIALVKPQTGAGPSRRRLPVASPVGAVLGLLLGCTVPALAGEQWALWRETVAPQHHAARIKFPLFTEHKSHLDCLYRLYRDLSHMLRTSVPPANDVRRIEATQNDLNVWTYREVGVDAGVVQEVRFACRPEP